MRTVSTTTTELGQRAEQAAARYLAANGFQVVELNFSVPKLCEIDIIAVQNDVIYFVEVKYRSSSVGGGGLEYITPTKLRHMQRAAQVWIRQNRFQGSYTLAAIEVSGKDYVVTSFIDSIY